jgi:hypothetical protein
VTAGPRRAWTRSWLRLVRIQPSRVKLVIPEDMGHLVTVLAEGDRSAFVGLTSIKDAGDVVHLE